MNRKAIAISLMGLFVLVGGVASWLHPTPSPWFHSATKPHAGSGKLTSNKPQPGDLQSDVSKSEAPVFDLDGGQRVYVEAFAVSVPGGLPGRLRHPVSGESVSVDRLLAEGMPELLRPVLLSAFGPQFGSIDRHMISVPALHLILRAEGSPEFRAHASSATVVDERTGIHNRIYDELVRISGTINFESCQRRLAGHFFQGLTHC